MTKGKPRDAVPGTAGEPAGAVILEEQPETGVVIVNGRKHMPDARGALVPLELIKAQLLLEDEMVRKVHGFAEDLHAQIARFRGHTMTDDLGAYDALLAQEYGARKGGAKGNRTYMTFDGLMKITVQVSEFIDFGPSLQVAKELIDECLNEWAAESRPEVRAVITKAFNTDKQGKINRTEIFKLLRLEIEDERWQNAMQAVRDAMRVIGSREYLRFHKRASLEEPWQAITIDLAKA